MFLYKNDFWKFEKKITLLQYFFRCEKCSSYCKRIEIQMKIIFQILVIWVVNYDSCKEKKSSFEIELKWHCLIIKILLKTSKQKIG